jgi:diguanylate cyclase (GGDEF)-like protein
MPIDFATLMLAGSFVAAVSGVYLIFAWLQDREDRGPLWWAGADLALAAGVPMLPLEGSTFGVPSTILGIALLNLSPALVWAAAVSSDRRGPNPWVVMAGAAIWLFAFAGGFSLSPDAQMALNLSIVAAYLFAAAIEFMSGRSAQLQARRPLVALLVLHGAFFAIGAVEAASGGLSPTASPTPLSWLGLIHFETLAFVVGTAIFAVALVKEHRELAEKTAARIDSLTGVATRGAFMAEVAALLDDGARRHRMALAVIDLDRFKSINDSFGHALGDRVLAVFGAAARATVGPTDMIGRLGGEEFAVAMPGSSAGEAFLAADRIRIAFSEACAALGIVGFEPTLSAGVAAAGPNSTIDSLLLAADRALYAAKAQGRDRVIVADRDAAVTAGPAEKKAENLAAAPHAA